jgi:hypothetical protein
MYHSGLGWGWEWGEQLCLAVDTHCTRVGWWRDTGSKWGRGRHSSWPGVLALWAACGRVSPGGHLGLGSTCATHLRHRVSMGLLALFPEHLPPGPCT